VRTTKDGHLMMFHDKNFARILPNASKAMKQKRLEDLTYDEAKRVDVGAFRGPQFVGQRMVSLAEICAALKKAVFLKERTRARSVITLRNVVAPRSAPWALATISSKLTWSIRFSIPKLPR